MADRLMNSLKGWSLVIGILIGVGGAVQSAMVLPYRVQAIEDSQKALKIKSDIDHDLLIKISQDVENMRDNLRYVKERLQTNNRP